MTDPSPRPYFVIGDVHGCAHTLERLVGRAPAGRQIVLLGDYVDRGPNARQAVAFVRRLVAERGVIALKGNHELLMCRAILGGRIRDNDAWISEGGGETLDSYVGANKQLLDDAQFLTALPLYHLDPPYLLSHAGIPPEMSLEQAVESEVILWNRDWLADDWQQVVGHTPQERPIVHPGRWAGIDTGAFRFGTLTGLLLPEWEVLQQEIDDRDLGA